MSGRLAIVAALAPELGSLRARAQIDGDERDGGLVVWSGRLAGREVLLAATGDGPRAATDGCQALVERWHPESLLVIGVAGGLAPAHKEGDLVTAATVVDLGLGQSYEPTTHLAWPAAARARLATIDRVAWTAAEKHELWRRLGSPEAAAVDMESAAFARVAERHGLPWGVLRAVIDPADEDLPLDFNRFRGADGRVRGSRVARHVALRPHLVPPLAELRRRMIECAETLASAVEESLA